MQREASPNILNSFLAGFELVAVIYGDFVLVPNLVVL